ncbi:DUF448 domain-containing protein [Paraconexibacter algicola]|uniref:DUF448 domain-containing protein n=1 Tax=Paraconexibacter algicola TaxID=2133960 RepID=A0A2T4UCF7_9ACTN|nr:DUF448 domain-containing protein [Paraconexibacter algicola]
MVVVARSPIRTCVGCRSTHPQNQLVRLAAHEGHVVPDPARALPGRGAYVCGAACLEQAVKRRALPRAFRQKVAIPVDLVESIG